MPPHTTNYPGYSEGFGELGCTQANAAGAEKALLERHRHHNQAAASAPNGPTSRPQKPSLGVGDLAMRVQELSCLLLDRHMRLYGDIATGPSNQGQSSPDRSAPPMGLIERLTITVDALEQGHAQICVIANYLGFEV